jgi:hypothetical protein
MTAPRYRGPGTGVERARALRNTPYFYARDLAIVGSIAAVLLTAIVLAFVWGLAR